MMKKELVHVAQFGYMKAIRIINGFLGAIELIAIRQKNLDFKHSPVFIIGPPRSGTTLLYQLLVERYSFAYISNFVAIFYQLPIVALWIEKHILSKKKKSNNFTSHYGQTKNFWGPHEAGEFWYRWFPRGEYVYVPPNTTPEQHLKELRQEILGMSKVTNAPMLFKNTYNTMRIAPIMESFPEACFLVCQRDPIDISQSILNGRVKFIGKKDHWWSMPPKEVSEIKGHPYWEQVVEQVYYAYKQIKLDEQRYGSEHFYYVDYEKLCKDTHKSLENIAQFLGRRGLRLSIRNSVPEQFHFSTGQKVSDEDYQRILKVVNRLWK